MWDWRWKCGVNDGHGEDIKGMEVWSGVKWGDDTWMVQRMLAWRKVGARELYGSPKTSPHRFPAQRGGGLCRLNFPFERLSGISWLPPEVDFGPLRLGVPPSFAGEVIRWAGVSDIGFVPTSRQRPLSPSGGVLVWAWPSFVPSLSLAMLATLPAWWPPEIDASALPPPVTVLAAPALPPRFGDFGYDELPCDDWVSRACLLLLDLRHRLSVRLPGSPVHLRTPAACPPETDASTLPPSITTLAALALPPRFGDVGEDRGRRLATDDYACEAFAAALRECQCRTGDPRLEGVCFANFKAGQMTPGSDEAGPSEQAP
ncbi:hypothetical protein Taro_012290 [Colocasia esculenta]|uniref:Uncharacterized protein n=1 Tax=Colocasia esculenta TaxID=4460 RepID=A0A843U8M4_COLES|nr:hypothetical protein [Colocasia esculenta]